MKILHLIQQPQLRGAEVFACQLATELNQKGHETVLVTLFKGDVTLPYDGLVICLQANASKRFTDFKSWKKLAEIIKKEKPDIIQANAGDTLKYAVFSKLFFRWNQPVIFRNASTLSLYIKSLPAKILNGLFYRYACHVVSVSETSKHDFIQLFPAKKNSISTIPIGVNTVALTPKKQNQHKIIVHVGGFTYEKNHTGLLRIFKKLLSTHPDSELHLIGDGPLKTVVEKQIQDLCLQEKVQMLGFRNDVMELINQADLLVLPSVIEGLPGVLLEAMYAKTPVIAYDVGGIKEIVQDGITGRLIEKGDENAFVAAIKQVFADSVYQQHLVHHAYERVMEHYTNDQVVKKFEALYKSVINASAK